MNKDSAENSALQFEQDLYDLPDRVTDLHPFAPHHDLTTEELQKSGKVPNILLFAGVNKAGKSSLEQRLPRSLVRGMSSTCAPEVVLRWNELNVEERAEWLIGAPNPHWHEYLLHNQITVGDIDSEQWEDEDSQRLAYDKKDALGKFYTEVLRRLRDRTLGGDAHEVIRRAFDSVKEGGAISGMRTPPDFHLIFGKLFPHINVHLVYVDAGTRRADNIRGHTERELMAIVPLVQKHFPDHITVIDNNGSEEDFLREVEKHAPRLKEFLGVEE